MCFLQQICLAEQQEVFGWGTPICSGQSTATQPTCILPLAELGAIKQLVCSDSCLFVLTKLSGKVYRMKYTVDSQVSKIFIIFIH